MIRTDVVAAWLLFRCLRVWRRQELTGHAWIRVDVAPGQPSTLQPRRWIPDEPLTKAAP